MDRDVCRVIGTEHVALLRMAGDGSPEEMPRWGWLEDGLDGVTQGIQ